MNSDDDSHRGNHNQKKTTTRRGFKKCIGCGVEFQSSKDFPEFMCNKCKKALQLNEREVLKKKIAQLAKKYDLEEREIFRRIVLQELHGTKEPIKSEQNMPGHKQQRKIRREVLHIVRAMNAGKSILGRAQTVDELIAEIYGIGPEKEKFYTRSWQKTLRSLRSEMKNHRNNRGQKCRKCLKASFLRKLYGHQKYQNNQFELEMAV